jgi:hypothetical protein
MESDEDDSPTTPLPGLHGLEMFDFDFQLAMWGPSFGIDVPRYRAGPLQLISQHELYKELAEQNRSVLSRVFAIHAIWHTLVYLLLNWLITPNFCITLLNWQIQIPQRRAIPIHLFLLLCVDPKGLKDHTITTLRILSQRGNSERTHLNLSCSEKPSFTTAWYP